jgi:hypothetical protein
MRTLALLAGLAAIVGIAVLVARDGEEAGGRTPGAVALVGDSLNVGIEPYLAGELPRWRIRNLNRVGRTTEEGLAVLEEERGSLPRHVVISLGTNDPSDATGAFRAAVRRAAVLAGASRCLLWVTIHRDGHEGFNDVLREEADRLPALRLVDWEALVDAHPGWLAPDGVHGTPDGYEARAAAVAEALERCGTGAA